jgi:streptogramin lyase
VDGNGNVWVTNKPASGTGSVVELDNTGNAIQNYTNFVNSPYGVAIDTANNAWITNTGDSPNSITMISSLGVSTNYPSPDLHTPAGIAIDGAGNVWVVNSASGANSLAGFTSGGTELAGSPYTGGGLNGPTSIAVNPIAPGSPGPMVTRKKALDPQ